MSPAVSKIERMAMMMIASIVVVCGLSLIFTPIIYAGSAAIWLLTATQCVVGHGLLTGSVYAGYHAYYNPNVSWSEFFRCFGQGFIVGCVSSTCSLAASAYPFVVARYLSISPHNAAALLGATCGFVTNTLANYMNDRDLFDNCKKAVILGACVGYACFGHQYGFGRDTEKLFTQIIENVNGIIRELVPSLTRFDWIPLCKEIFNFRAMRHQAESFNAMGQGLVAYFALWITSSSEKTAGAIADDSFNPTRTPRPDSSTDEQPPQAASPSSLVLDRESQVTDVRANPGVFDQLRFQSFDQPPASVTQSGLSMSHDSHSDDSNVTSSSQTRILSSRESAAVQIMSKSARQSQIKLSKKEKCELAIKKQVVQIIRDGLPAEAFDENTYISNMDQLMKMNLKYKEIAETIKEHIEEQNDIYVTATSGGVRQNPASSSNSFPSSNERHNRSLGQGHKTHQSDIPERTNRTEEDRISNTIHEETCTNEAPEKNYKIATVHKLITIDDKNEYTLTNSEEWPHFDGKMRVIGLMGAPKSGKTTLGQAILFQMGYAISQAQATLTKLPIGVHAYVLHEDNVIIVECCEGMDPPVGPHAPEMSRSPYGALPLELLMYIFCMKIIYMFPFHSTKVDNIKVYARKRIYMYMSGALELKAARFQHILFVLRVTECEDDYEKELEILQNYFSVPTSQQSLLARAHSLIWGATDAEIEPVTDFNTITVHALRLYQMDDSVQLRNKYNKQLKDIVDMITCANNDESGNNGIMNDQPINCPRFHRTLELIWTKLAESKRLEQIIANIRAEEEVEAKEDSFKVKEYFDDINAFIKKLNQPRCKHLKHIVDDYKKHRKEMNEKSEEFKKQKDNEQTPELFVASVVKSAHLILRKSIDIDIWNLKQEGVKIGLEGFALLVKGGIDTNIEMMALRMAIFDCRLISYLKNPYIHEHFPDCWFLLTRLARSGYRLPVLEFDIWKAANVHLKRDHFTDSDQANIYLQILSLLGELTDSNPARCVPDLVRHTDIFFTRDIPMELIAFDFEKNIKEDVERCITEILKKPPSKKDDPPEDQDFKDYKKWLNFPKTWFERSEYSKAQSGTDLKKEKKKLFGTLTSRNFEVLYLAIAEIFSREVVNRASDLVAKKYDDKNKEIEKMRLHLWKNIAENSRLDKNLFCSLLETELLEFLIKEFIVKRENSANFPLAHNTLCAIIEAEKNYKDDEMVKKRILERCGTVHLSNDTNVHTVTQVADRDKRWNLAQRWTLSRLRCLECGVVEKLIAYFLANIKTRGTEFLLSALITYFVNGSNEKEKCLSERIYLTNRKVLLDRITLELGSSAREIQEMVERKHELNETNYAYQTQIGVLKAGCQFINLIMAVFYHNQTEKYFFGDIKENEKHPDDSAIFKNLFSVARNMYPICTSETIAGSKREMDKHLGLHYFNMILNLASVSQRSINTILNDYNIVNIGIVEHAADPIQITRTEQQFVDLKLNVECKDHHKLIIIGAELLKNRTLLFTDIVETLTKQIKQLQKDIEIMNAEKKKYMEWVQKETRHRERKLYEESKETKMAVTSQEILVASSVETTFAIESVPHCCPHFNHYWPKKPSYNDIKGVYKVAHDAILDAYTLFLLNRINPVDENFLEVMRFVGNLAKSTKKPVKLGKTNKFVIQMLQLLHFDVILGKCGYTMQEDYIFHSKLPIQELLERRPGLNRVPLQLRFILVRVTHKDNSTCYQAVLTPQAKIRDVVEQLKPWKMSVVYLNEDGDLNDMLAKELREIGGFLIQLTGY